MLSEEVPQAAASSRMPHRVLLMEYQSTSPKGRSDSDEISLLLRDQLFVGQTLSDETPDDN